MRVLVGCEESGVVRDAFAALGYDAWSCDLLPTRRTGNHLQIDIVRAILDHGPWDIIILHPPCTALAVSGNRHYGVGKPKELDRVIAKVWTKDLYCLAISRATIGVALENPVGMLGSAIGKPTQYIQPYQFGHMEQKKTGLWLCGLPPLEPTADVYTEMIQLPLKDRQRIWYMSPSEDRARLRSETYTGIAQAMAEQWGSYGHQY